RHPPLSTLFPYTTLFRSHHDGIIMAYLRKEKILVEADAFTPGAAGAEPLKVPNPFSVALEANVRRLNIDVDQILPLHGRMVPYRDRKSTRLNSSHRTSSY